MAKEIIDKILTAEKENIESVENAKITAEKNLSAAKNDAVNFYKEEIKKAKDDYNKAINAAKKEADMIIKKAEDDSLLERDKFINSLKSKQDKALDQIIQSIIK